MTEPDSEVERNGLVGSVEQLVVAIQRLQPLRRFRPQHQECW